MGRKIAGKLLVLILLLAALYRQQDIFAQNSDSRDVREIEEEQESGEKEEGEEDGEVEPDPLVLYRVEYEKQDGETSYYREPPSVKITHPGKRGETVFFLQSGDSKREGRLKEEGSTVVISPEEFQEGRSMLEIWMEAEGKKIRHQQIEFKVDTTAPVMAVRLPDTTWQQYEACVKVTAEDGALGSGVKNVVCYVNGRKTEHIDIAKAAEGKAEFRIREHSSGGKAVAIRIVAWDYAGNAGSWEGRVFIDRVCPIAEIKGAADYSVTGKDTEVVFTASDDNLLKTAEVRIVRTDPRGNTVSCQNGTWSSENGHKIYCQKLTKEGKYQLDLKAEDMAGFTAGAKAQIVIDKKAPVISKVSEIDGRYLQEFCWNYPETEYIQDFTSCSCTVTVDGKFYFPGQSLTKEGRHQMKVEAVDQAGNRSEERADFTIDRTAPDILIQGITDGKSYEPEANVDIRIRGEKDWLTEVKVNGKKEILPEKCHKHTLELKDPGIYEIEVRAEDEAKNRAVKTMMIEILPEETAVQKLLRPVQKALGLKQETFAQEEQKTKKAGSHAEELMALLLALPAAACIGVGVRKLLREGARE